MLKTLGLLIVSLSVVLNISCSTKDTKEEAPAEDSAAISEKGIEVDPLGSDSGNINGLATVQFGYDQFSLSADARRMLSENMGWIKDHGDYTIQIEGHCDSRGSVEYNLALGEKRAKAVKNYLVSLGVSSKRLTIISYGKEKLLAMGDSESDHDQNRRANFVPLPR
ncbi:MAG: OmpA family protein [Bdellovibrionaceae bacterium]|nr:OmpA family protein [Pseudobdellovibrionaceae bacterium]